MSRSKNAALLCVMGIAAFGIAAAPAANAQWHTPHRGDRGDHGGRDEKLRSLDSQQDGDGAIVLQGRKDRDLDTVRVNLSPGGRAEITLLNHGGKDRTVLTGRWDQSGRNDNVTLSVNGRIGRRPSNFKGTVNLREKDRGKFDRLQLDDTSDNKGTSIHFTAK